MVPEASVLEPTTAKGSLQDGVDSLWKFQVRKENSILLESYEGHTKLLQSLAAENLKNKKDFDERMAALEATVRHLQSEERKDRHAFEKYSEEMATLRTQIGGVVDKLERHDQRLDQGTGTSRGRPSSRDGIAGFTEICNTKARINGTTTSTDSNDQHASTSTKVPKYVPAPECAPITTAGLYTTTLTANASTDDFGPTIRCRSRSRSIEPAEAAIANVGLNTANVSTDLDGPMTRNRSQSRTKSASVEPTIPKSSSSSSASIKRKNRENQGPNNGMGNGIVDAFGRVGKQAKKPQTKTDTIQSPAPASEPQAKANISTPTSTPASQAVKIPRLHQGTNSLKTYLDKATAIFLSLPNQSDQKLEVEFIALFIKGMRDADKRDILVAELQQAHSSRTKKDGKIEVLCKWADVEEGMEATGLFKVENLSGGPKKAVQGQKISRFLKELMD